MVSQIVDRLLQSDEPSVRWRVRAEVLREPVDSAAMRLLREEVRRSPRVQALLTHRGPDGRSTVSKGVYAKWQGAHWVLATLADIGYPPGDEALRPMAEQVQDAWLTDAFYEDFEATSKAQVYNRRGVPVMQGRHRRCASQQGNALRSICVLGLTNDRTPDLVERLLHWQWPDGGWNCDKDPSADTSSFMETLTPMRGLAAFARESGNPKARAAVARAATVFLDRQLYKRKSNGATIRGEFVKLHYPLYWHYDILGGLKVMNEAGMIRDRRCSSALQLLRDKQLPDGGYPAEARHYKTSRKIELSAEMVDWGGTSKRVANPWVTADALTVFNAAEMGAN